MYSDSLFVMLKTCGNAPALVLTGLLRLSPKPIPQISKNRITLIWYPPPLIIPVLYGKLSTTLHRKSSILLYYITHPHLPTPQPVHLLTTLPPFSLTKISEFHLFMSDNSFAMYQHSVSPRTTRPLRFLGEQNLPRYQMLRDTTEI